MTACRSGETMEERSARDPATGSPTAPHRAADLPQQPLSSTTPSSWWTPTVERVVYVPKDKECPTFTGKGEMTITNWMDDITSSLLFRQMPPVEQAYFIYEHLSGDARDEIKYRSRQVREDPNRIFDILQTQFGCSDSPVVLMCNFLSRKQQRNETLWQYANALFALMDTAVRFSPGGVPCSAMLLRDQFVECVSDYELRRVLRGIVRRNPDFDLHDVRDAAVQWM